MVAATRSNPMSAAPHVVFLLFWPVLTPRNQLMVRALREQGWRVSVVAWDRGGEDAVGTPDSVRAEVDDWHWVRVAAGRGAWRLLTALPRLYRALGLRLAALPPHDVCFLTHFFLLPLAKNISAVRLFDAAEFYVRDLPRRLGPFAALGRPLVQWVERRWLRRVQGVLVVDSSLGWFERYYRAMHSNVQVLWNLPSLADDADAAEVQSLEDRYRDRKLVAYVGGIFAGKGLDRILCAAVAVRAHHPDVLFLLIGPIREEEARVRRHIQTLGLEEHVRFLPFMSYRSMQAHLGWARIGLALYLLPRFHSAGSGGGRKIFTYMQAGLPIVTTRIGSLGRVVEEAGCGVRVDPDEVGAVGQSICAWLDDPEAARRCGSRGREAFEREYNWERVSGDFLSFVERIRAAGWPGRGGGHPAV